MAANEAANASVRVAVVNKGAIQRTGATIMAPGGLAAVGSWKAAQDSPELHMEDTIKGGAYLNNQEMVRVLTREAADMVLELESIGAIFQREPDGKKFALISDSGHSHFRSNFLDDRTGKEMLKALTGGLRKLHVPFFENVMITRLLIRNGTVAGAVGVHTHTLEPVLFECGALILATGGAGALFDNNDNSVDLTGDGYALALGAGARLRDMEFVQFLPTGFLFPPSIKGMMGGMAYYGRLYNQEGERFMQRYDPVRMEKSTRDVISQAIMREVREGRGTSRGGVYLDYTYEKPDTVANLPAVATIYKNLGINPQTDRIEVAPTVHFFMGGLDVNTQWAGSVPGLYGAGEACGGMHGANRLSQNALAELLVSGRIAGKSAACYSEENQREPIDPSEASQELEAVRQMLKPDKGISPLAQRARIKEVMWRDAGVLRSGKSLERALAEIEEIEKQPVMIAQKNTYMNKSVMQALENRSLLLTAKVVIQSAFERKESRGAHCREDYPDMDNRDHLYNVLTYMGNDRIIEISRRPVEPVYIRPKEE